MDLTHSILTIAVPFCLFTGIVAVALGPIANRLARLRKSL